MFKNPQILFDQKKKKKNQKLTFLTSKNIIFNEL